MNTKTIRIRIASTDSISRSNSFIHYVFQNILHDVLDTLKFPIFDFLWHIFPNSNGVGAISKIKEKRPGALPILSGALKLY